MEGQMKAKEAGTIGILHVNGTKQPPYRTKVNIRGARLADFGFVCGSPVIAVPRHEGFALFLGDVLTHEGSKLIHVGMEGKKHALCLNFANNFDVGLVFGDFLAARYEYGAIEARKLPAAWKYYVVDVQNHSAFLRLCGAWVDDAGFLPDIIATVAIGPGGITLCVLDEPAVNYSEVVKFARARKYQLVQAQKNQHLTHVDLDGYMLNNAGFEPGDICGVRYKPGTITLFKPDLHKLGF